jgi:FixJ family two-component response regulator
MAGVDPSMLQVLVVDDERSVAEELADGLALNKLRVRQVNSAREALEILRERDDFGVVVTDIRMPGEDGIALARALLDRAGEASFRPEVILITGHATLDDAEEAIRAGVSDFLRKPFRLDKAVSSVRIALAKAARRLEAARAVNERETRLSTLEEERGELVARVRELNARLKSAPAAGGARAEIERDLAAISHALRTPLNAISGGATLLGTEQGSPEKAWCLEVVRQGVVDAVRAVELLEEMHRLERAGAEPDAVGRDVQRLIRSAAAAIEPVAADLGVQVAWCGVPRQGGGELPARIGRVLELCGLAALAGAARGWTISIGQMDTTEQAQVAVLAVVARPPRSTTLGDGAPPAATESRHALPQETLALAVARRMASLCNGTITSWRDPDGSAVLRLTLHR